MKNDLHNVETQFFRNLGNGILAGQHLEQLFQSCVNQRDTTVLVRTMTRAKTEKADEQAARTIAFVARHVWPGAKLSKDKNGNQTLKIKGITADTDAMNRLHTAVEKGLSIRHTTFRKTVQGKTSTSEYDAKKAAASFVARARKAGMKPAAIKAAVDAALKT